MGPSGSEYNGIGQDSNATARPIFDREGFRRGIVSGLPILPGVVPFGIVFGVMARQASLGFGDTALMSGMVFAGASQMVALGQWQAPLPILSIVFTTTLVNLRLILMGASLRPWFEKLPAWQSYGSMFLLTDAGWAFQLREFKEGRLNAAFLAGNGAVQWVVWVLSSILGFWLGTAITRPEKFGLDFIVPASFLALLIGMWRGKSDILPWLVALVAALISSILIAGNWYILIGGLAGSLTGAFLGADEVKDE